MREYFASSLAPSSIALNSQAYWLSEREVETKYHHYYYPSFIERREIVQLHIHQMIALLLGDGRVFAYLTADRWHPIPFPVPIVQLSESYGLGVDGKVYVWSLHDDGFVVRETGREGIRFLSPGITVSFQNQINKIEYPGIVVKAYRNKRGEIQVLYAEEREKIAMMVNDLVVRVPDFDDWSSVEIRGAGMGHYRVKEVASWYSDHLLLTTGGLLLERREGARDWQVVKQLQ
jgi:hypothetical protein